MEEKLSGIVVGGVNYGESDKILNIFTLEQGMVSAKIKGVKKAGAKLKFASEPFCFAEYVFSKSGDRRTVIGASLIDSFYSLREDVYKFYAGSVVLEFVRKFQKENIVSEKLFNLTIEALKDITYTDADYKYSLVKFLVLALEEIGYALDFTGCFECGCKLKDRVFFDYNFGGFFCDECKTDHCREINFSTYQSLLGVINGEQVLSNNLVKCLRLINFYVENKPEEKIKTLTELLNLLNIV
ncbi:MAG: DNA repair protein RecO [Clostridia bacterium]|nr:DNA repair protein RecO [Clostridia bacterium]